MTPFNIYFAGELFDHKHLTGNKLLAQSIEKISNNQFRCHLPQDPASTSTSFIGTRNNDLGSVIKADVILLNFDGPDLDSGTVAEFMIAKMLDIPAILLRTDFRSVDYALNYELDDPWNLMCSGYPRTRKIVESCMTLYHKYDISGMHVYLAEKIIKEIEVVMEMPTLFSNSEEIQSAYAQCIKACGSKLDSQLTKEYAFALIQSKIEKNIYVMNKSAADSSWVREQAP